MLRLGHVAGNPRAQASLAGMYQRGIGTARDADRALDLYRRAAAKGDARTLLDSL